MHTRRVAVVTLAVTILLSLAACGWPGLPGGDPLEGTSWVLLVYGGTSPIPQTQITLGFDHGQVGGSAGCNTYGGSYGVSGDRITLSDLYMTEMACLDPPGVMDQEQEYLRLLGKTQTFQVTNGQLQLFTSDGQALIYRSRD